MVVASRARDPTIQAAAPIVPQEPGPVQILLVGLVFLQTSVAIRIAPNALRNLVRSLEFPETLGRSEPGLPYENLSTSAAKSANNSPPLIRNRPHRNRPSIVRTPPHLVVVASE